MTTEHPLERSMQGEQMREALNLHWRASAAGDSNTEHDIYDDDLRLCSGGSKLRTVPVAPAILSKWP
jgi:hypothetical protein